nr:hypothetical protein [Tanacetum cinerariifolium]
RHTHTPATIDTKSDLEEAPSKTKEFEASKPSDTKITSPYFTAPLDFTTLSSPDHPVAQTSHALTQASYYHMADNSSDLDTKREGLVDEIPGSEDGGHGSKDECPGSEEEDEEAAPEGQQQAVLILDTAIKEPLGLGYEALRRHELALGEGSRPSTFDMGQSSRPM